MLPDIPKDKQLILFDGVCNLCSASVQFILQHDKKEHFVFSSLQGKTGTEIITHFNIDTAKTDSILLYTGNENLHVESTAALRIASKLGFPLNMLRIFIILPPFIRNAVYRFIARNRYKWFGKTTSCFLPSKALQARFVD